MKETLTRYQIYFYGGFLVLVVLTAFIVPAWGVKKPLLIKDNMILGNHDLLYFATDAPDNFIIYSPGLQKTLLILPGSERMADMVVSPDGKYVWAATKSGFVDRYAIPVDEGLLALTHPIKERIAPVLSSVALSANGRFIAVAYGNSEDYNARNVKILPSDTVSLSDELADFAVMGDIQDIVANPVEDVFYIINSHSDRVRIYNSDRFRLEPDIIELGNSPGTFVVRPDGKRGYGAMNARSAVAVVDLEVNETVDYVSLGYPPYAMCFNPEGSRLYVASRDSSTVSIIDTETNNMLTTFDLAPRLEGLIEFNFAEMIGVSSDERYFYVMPKRQELLVYDISNVRDPAHAGEKPQMVQSEFLATTPFFMEVVRGHRVTGLPD